ncbi:c-type cytochrome [Photobacterium lipolyticum]|uniref:Cytochrome C n=1 Tax=Photobacterium lipolyticum TaxID=266810 RepID=A0A2T3N2L0_9GAMM|nr:c-type cytochrome [Photobacterium lipolyticum]PSW06578.1 cytochrome C [Photobacterium lipolyticum]
MNKNLIFILLFAVAGLTGCEPSSTGFSLPAGNVVNGEKVFLTMQCLECHTMEGFDQPESAVERATASVALGGEVKRIKNYAELVTSIINPSHQIAEGYELDVIQYEGQSIMPSYNDALTVTQLIDLVTFLESRYELEPYEPTLYSPYR